MTSKREFIATDAASWDEVNAIASDFADGVIREVSVVSGEHVDVHGVLHYGGYPRLAVHAQMQGAGGTSVRLVFVGVRKFGYDYDMEVSPAVAQDVGPGLWEVRVLGLRVTAETCETSVVGSQGLGKGPFLLNP